MRVRIKVCGVTTEEVAAAIGESGVDAAGFVFAPSPRRVTIETAVDLARRLPVFVTRVAVFRLPSESEIVPVVQDFAPDLVQTEVTAALVARLARTVNYLPVLHDSPGDGHPPAPPDPKLVRYSAVLLEGPGPGGRGIRPDWTHAAALAARVPVVLAGGLTPENVGDAIRQVRPHGVDVSSGVESARGTKDPERIVAFVRAVRAVERQLDTPAEVPR